MKLKGFFIFIRAFWKVKFKKHGKKGSFKDAWFIARCSTHIAYNWKCPFNFKVKGASNRGTKLSAPSVSPEGEL